MYAALGVKNGLNNYPLGYPSRLVRIFRRVIDPQVEKYSISWSGVTL